jgi:hypothetical protein
MALIGTKLGKRVIMVVEKLEERLGNVVSPTKYDLYYETLDRRLFAVKNVSTDPRIHGYVEGVDVDEARALADDYARPLTTVKRFDWEHDKPKAHV